MQNLSWAACDSREWRGEYNKLGVWKKAGEGAWGMSHLKPDMLWSGTSQFEFTAEFMGWLQFMCFLHRGHRGCYGAPKGISHGKV